MKKLKQYIKQYIREGLRLSIDDDPYQYHPKTWDELRQIIEDRFKELGPGTAKEPINFNDIDVSGMTTFHNEDEFAGIFQNTKFKYIDVSDWDVSKIKDMSWMFSYCEKLESVGDLFNWDVSKVKNMEDMFSECPNLKSIGDLSNWDVSKVVYAKLMFFNCINLKSVGDLSNWDVSNIEDAGDMFIDSGITNIPDWYKNEIIK